MRLLNLKEWELPNKLNQGLNANFIEKFYDEIFSIISEICFSKNYSLEIFGVSMTLFHYYTFLKSFNEFDRAEVAISCVFLANKIEFTFLQKEEAINIFRRYRKDNKEPDLTKFEIDVLSFIGFDMEIKTPYHSVNRYINKYWPKLTNNYEFLNLCMKLVNDSYRGKMCIFFPAKYIALASIYVSFNLLDINEINNFEISQLKIYENSLNEKVFENCVNELLNIIEMRKNIE